VAYHSAGSRRGTATLKFYDRRDILETALGPLQSVPGTMTQRRCSFCGKRRHQVKGLATSVGNPAGKLAGDAAICAECLILCREIHSEQLA
jgi:hypothetical protein